ncbi:hypothetical protein Tco_1267520 [Tanacetum coccineum]
MPVPVNNWASALASTYACPPENSLLAQTSNIAIFMDWFCKKQGITDLKQQDLEGPAYEIVKVFHPNVSHDSRFNLTSSSTKTWSIYDTVARVAGLHCPSQRRRRPIILMLA